MSTPCLAYPFYMAPVLFPKQKWLGLAPAFFEIMQAVEHGLVFPRVARRADADR